MDFTTRLKFNGRAKKASKRNFQLIFKEDQNDDHGMILFDYIIQRNGVVKLEQINSPERDFTSPIQVFEKILEHEKYVTESINCVATMSEDECDLATRHFINWYISEQVEEEANARDVITKLKMFGDEKASLYHLDCDLAKREYKTHTY